MRLVFLILAHDRPEQTLELARALVAAASDGIAVIHYDARSPAAELVRLEAAAAGEPRIRLVAERVACRWGSFGLVEAPLNALRQIEAEGIDPAYVILLSGACLPCRPVAALERYLAENAGREFIEVADASWVGNGWRHERWKYRFWFDHKTQHTAEWLSFQLQRLFGLARRFPKGLTPRFGSQWWALTWDTCRAMLLDIDRDPARLEFFRTVWIPDEMVIQTWVHALVAPGEIAQHGLTHFQFSNRGKPVVFHDDHAGYVASLDSFFVRKVSPRALALRAACLARAAAPDDGAPFGPAAPRREDYRVKILAQTWYPGAGQIFYRDQQVDMADSVLATAGEPYVVVLGPPALTRAVVAALAERGTGERGTGESGAGADELTCLGAVFAPGEVDLGLAANHEANPGAGREADGAPGGAPRQEIGGLGRGDRAIRDMHPALFLTRLRARCPGVPVMTWSPFEAPELLEAVLRDPAALVVACLPFTGDAERDRRLLALASRRDPALERVPASAFAGIDPGRVARARLDSLADAGGVGPGWPGRDLLYPMQDGTRLHRSAVISLPWRPAAAPGGGLDALQRRQMLEDSLAGCRFASAPWFRSLAHGLRRAWAERLEGGSEALLGPLPPAGAALFGESAPIDPAPADPAPIDPAPIDPTSVAPAPPGEEAAPVRELIRFPEARR